MHIHTVSPFTLMIILQLTENQELKGFHRTLKVIELVSDAFRIRIKDCQTLEVVLEKIMILKIVAFVFPPILSLFKTFNELGPVPHLTRLSD